MFVSLNWIKKYTTLPEDLSMNQLAYDLTMRTVEVEGWENPASKYKNVVIGEILEVLPHPDADKLRICRVDVNQGEPLQIVCGGSNLEVGQLVVVAMVGSFVQWHGEGELVEIKPAKLRGVASTGMICASDELGLGTLFPEEDGIIMDFTDFPGAVKGQNLAETLDLDDMIIEIDNKSLTNRPDLWGHYGIARELSAIYSTELKALPSFELPANLDPYEIVIENEGDCPRYSASVWTGVENVESSYELKKVLHSVGQSSHGFLVDITNYIMLALGQPNHAYDKDRIGDTIVVRRAKEKESLVLLDNIKVHLDSEDLVISTNDKAIGLAGIKGGMDDSVLPSTTEIVLEIANFEPIRIRKTAKKHRVHTDAASRFEKGLDLPRVEQAFALFAHLIKNQFPEAKLVAYSDTNLSETAQTEIQCRLESIQAKLGKPVSVNEISKLLSPLGFNIEHGDDGTFTILVPSWRSTGDVESEADIVEEIARMVGYENFEFVAPSIDLNSAVIPDEYDFDRKFREFLAYSGGMQEIFTHPWTSKIYQSVFGFPNAESISLTDPPSPEEAYLDQSLLPGLVKAAKKNERYFSEFSLFNVAQVFRKNIENFPSETGEVLPIQKKYVAGLIFSPDAWTSFRNLKGIIESAAKTLHLAPFKFEQSERPEWADPEVHLDILSHESEKVGVIGLLSVFAKTELGFKRGNIALFELDLDKLYQLSRLTATYQNLPNFPLVEMDFTLLCEEKVSWREIKEITQDLVYSVKYIGEYRSKDIGAGNKSLTFRVQFGKEDGTLSGEEIEAKRETILDALKTALGIGIR